MPKIKNKLFQPLTILLERERTLYLRPREEAEVSAGDLNSPHFQSLVKAGDVGLIEGRGESPPAGRVRRRDE